MADEESLRQKVLLEVQDAYLSLVESRERIAVAELWGEAGYGKLGVSHGALCRGRREPYRGDGRYR
jgi:hypothetical protein